MIYNYLIVGLVPEPLKSRIAMMQTRWQFRKQSLLPHITIVPPFNLPGFSTQASILNKAHAPLNARVKIQGYSSFRNRDENVACLKINSPDLQRLLEGLTIDLPQLSEPLKREKIVFHISIARGIPDDELTRVMEELQAEPFEETFTLDKLTIYQREIGKKWYEIL